MAAGAGGRPLDDLPDEQLSLVELLNRVLDRGVVLTGDAMISVAGIDLVHLGLRLVLTSVEAERRRMEGGAEDG